MANIPEFIKDSSKTNEKRAIESTYQDAPNVKSDSSNKEVYTTIKVRKEYKKLFDELAHEAYQSRIDFIEDLIEYWRKGHKKS
ncbi:conserved hypothetical protein [Staphylococcus capitis]|nr:conserved hypothetical protein [Staphylococcus capitis]